MTMLQPIFHAARRGRSLGWLPAVLVLVAACGGTQSGAKSGPIPPPPQNTRSENAPPGKGEVKREVSKDAKKDYESAAEFFTSTDKAHGWNDGTCRQAADRFTQ